MNIKNLESLLNINKHAARREAGQEMMKAMRLKLNHTSSPVSPRIKGK
jgi:hypothetical protein